MKSSFALPTLETWPSCSRSRRRCHCQRHRRVGTCRVDLKPKSCWRYCCCCCCRSRCLCRCELAFCELFGAQCVGAVVVVVLVLVVVAWCQNSQHRIRCGRCRRCYHCWLCLCLVLELRSLSRISTSQAVFGVSSKRGSFLSAFCIILLI